MSRKPSPPVKPKKGARQATSEKKTKVVVRGSKILKKAMEEQKPKIVRAVKKAVRKAAEETAYRRVADKIGTLHSEEDVLDTNRARRIRGEEPRPAERGPLFSAADDRVGGGWGVARMVGKTITFVDGERFESQDDANTYLEVVEEEGR